MQTTTPRWKKALELLVKGNERFVSGVRSADARTNPHTVRELARNGQKPFAIILSCSDSRVPAEFLFDCGFGDLFVVRVAGNVVQPSQIASIEYAAKVLGAELCVVMGHTGCGAVQAAVDSELGKQPNLGPNIDFLIELIRPAVHRCMAREEGIESARLLEQSIRENVHCTANLIFEESSLLCDLAHAEKFAIVEALAHLETGLVEVVSLYSDCVRSSQSSKSVRRPTDSAENPPLA